MSYDVEGMQYVRQALATGVSDHHECDVGSDHLHSLFEHLCGACAMDGAMDVASNIIPEQLFGQK